MFKLLRYFSLTSAVAIIVITALIVVFYDKYSENNLIESLERQNVILASFISNDLTERLPKHFQGIIHGKEDLARKHHVTHISKIDQILENLLKGLPVLQIKAYRGALTIYSPDHDQIGMIHNSPAFLTAKNKGTPTSQISFLEKINTFGKMISDRYVVETYVPITGDDELIIEIYTDATPLVSQITQTKVTLFIGLIMLFGVLYGALFLIIRRADNIIRQQYTSFGKEITDRRRVEGARIEEESRFKAVINGSPAAITIKDCDGQYILVNRTYERWVGASSSELRGKTIHDFLPQDQVGEIEALDQEVIQTGKDIVHESVRWFKDGQTRNVVSHKFPIFSASGEINAVSTIITDITEQVDTAKELDFQRLALNEHAIVSITDVKGDITYANDKFFDISGYSREELLGQNHRILKSGVHSPEFYRDLWRTVAKGKTWHGEIKNRKKCGDYYWVKATIVPFLNNEGKPFQYVAIRTEITERKLVEEALRTSHEELETRVSERTKELSLEVAERARAEQFLRDALESIDNGAILIDRDDRVVMWNSNYEKSFTGISDVLAPGAHFENIIRAIAERGLVKGAKEDVESFVSRRVRQHEEYNGPFELEMVDGHWVMLSEYKTQDGGTFIVRTDITEHKRTEQALVEAKHDAEMANQAKSEFLANMSHELRTPLNAIIGFSELTHSQSFGPVGHQKYIEYAADINQSGTHLLAIINDILDLSAVEAGKIELNTEPVGLATLVTVAEQFLVQKANDEGVRIINTVGMETPMIMADKRRVKQILINLLSNAVKFTPRDGTVTIGADLDADGCIALVISDTGIGMDEAEIAKAQEPFGQADSTLSRKYEGTGLGLPLSKSLMEAHGGTLEIESSPGKGTTITVRFPAEGVIVGSEIEEGPSKDSSAEKRLH